MTDGSRPPVPKEGARRRGRGPLSETMARRTVVVLVGPKGSGKTHIGTLLREKLGIPFLRVEPIFLANMRTSALTGAALDAEGYAMVLRAVDGVLATERRVVIESTGASDAFPAFLDALRERCEVRLVSVRASPARCLERVRTRDRTLHIPVSDERVEAINARAASVGLPWDLEIDNDAPVAPEVIIRLLRRIV